MPRGVAARCSIAWTAVALFFVTACGAGTAENPTPDATTGKPEPTTTSSSPSGREEVFFPEVRQEGGLDAVPTAMGGGELVLDDEGCLRMLLPGKGSESGWVPVWPPYFEPKTGGGRVRIVDERSGRVVAEVGKGVVMSGGDISKEALTLTAALRCRAEIDALSSFV
ncbi:MAG: hypothetical protein M3534_15850, partial [Actinomycetota bacterium]|nr:hypothetical protein [Actinomycetota bacterium]